jgi:hypothetical protein
MNEYYVRSKSVVSRQVGNDTLVVPIRGGVGDLASIFSLNEIASSIWAMLVKPATFDAIITQIVEQFDVSRSLAEEDLESFLTKMRTAGLVEAATFEQMPEIRGEMATLHPEVA